ncbi:MAG: ATP phosphoribosyltransferase regulatory subunit [Leptolyngbyaceae cyanobacterium SL_7_1]|nr:ATP phosphoribosyltransferase regulatory subunit [Leptolyngbyaceae cyanobacterium SL_7_1]
MVHQSPAGTRDLLPLDVAQKRWVEERLQDVFHRWGYQRIITSTLERMDTLMAGGAIEASTVIQLQQVDDEVLGLRPELTASVARAAVTRLAAVTHPQRLYYNANVFRRANRGEHNRQLEFYQAGVELLGAAGVAADAEILLLLADCLNQLALGQWHLVLGEAGLTQSLLSVFPEGLRQQVRRSIAQLDRLAIEALPLSHQLKQHALLLLDLRGRPADVLQRVSTLALTDEQRAIVTTLKSLIDLLSSCYSSVGSIDASPNLILDLSLIRPFDYYTGIVFEVVGGEGGRRVLGQGGRYDRLLGLYHPKGDTRPGIGFVLNSDELHQVLLTTGQLPDQTPTNRWLIVPATADDYRAAFAYAQKIRESTNLVQVEVDLGGRDRSESVQTYAQQRGISQIAWINSTGTPRIESLGARIY